jgi:hypothetical protein
MRTLLLFAGPLLLGFGVLFLLGLLANYLLGCRLYRHQPLATPDDMEDFDFFHERSTAFWRPLTRTQRQRLLVSLAVAVVGAALLWAAGRA